MEENNEVLAEFVGKLSELNEELSEVFRTGNVALFTDMNKTIKEIYALHHGSGDEAFALIEPDCEVIYRNFDMMIAVLKTTEEGVIDAGAQKALNKFLHNIHEAVINIATIFGLA